MSKDSFSYHAEKFLYFGILIYSLLFACAKFSFERGNVRLILKVVVALNDRNTHALLLRHRSGSDLKRSVNTRPFRSNLDPTKFGPMLVETGPMFTCKKLKNNKTSMARCKLGDEQMRTVIKHLSKQRLYGGYKLFCTRVWNSTFNFNKPEMNDFQWLQLLFQIHCSCNMVQE